MFWYKKQKVNIPPGGCLESPRDRRDVLMSEVYPMPVRIAPELPPPFDLDVLNQGSTPRCVGYSAAAIKQEKELRERRRVVFNGDWLYARCKELDGLPNMRGTSLRIAMKILQKQGAKPQGELETEAVKYRIGGYARVDDLTFEGIKKAIYVNGILLAGFHGSNQGWQTAYIRPPKAGEYQWGHAIALIGYNKDYLIFQNSWSENWGEKGIGYIPKDYMPFESWCILTDLPFEFLADKKEGWIAEDWVQLRFVKDTILTTTSKLNFREQPSIGSSIIRTLANGEKVIYQGERIKAGNYWWLRVRA
ncbi:SH3 domain-containing protein [Candidatus Wolfebacteria bacterium]|nr:SH3 domain-containing protein [Candidatus Wolfebacteria bacterium]